MADSKFKTRVKAQAGVQLPAEAVSRALTVDSSGDIKSSNVTTTELGYVSGVTSPIQTQLTNTSNGLSDHLTDTVDAHDASAISNIPSGNLTATDIQAAVNELQSDIDTRATQTALNDHINDTTDAHDASAISNVPAGNLAATDVQAALNELQSDIDTRALDSIVIKKDGSVAFTAAQSMGGFKLTSLAAGTAASDAVNKGQMDAALEGLKPKAAVRVATTANITIATALNSGDVIDGITLANGDRVLVKDQTAAEQNGIYVVSATPARSTDFDSLSPIDEINGSLVAVQEGTTNAGKVFVQSGTVAVLDTDPINFVFFNSSSTLVGGDGITVSGSNISVDHDGEGLTFVATQLALELDGTTLSKSAAGLKVNSITSAEVSDFNEAAQDAVGAIVGTSTNIALTYNDGANTIVGSIVAASIVDADINGAAGIDASKIANGSVSNAEFQQLDGLTSPAVGTTQSQTLTNKTIVVANNTITTAASGNLTATELNAALAELQADIDGQANKTLSNLTSPTAINQDLIFDKTTPILKSKDTTGVDSASLSVLTGSVTTTGSSGSLTLSSGPSVSASGVVLLSSGNTTGTSIPTGAVTIRSGNTGAGNASSGAVTITTGTSSGTNVTGALVLSTGVSPGLAGSGNISMISGNVTTNTSGSSGIITIASGTSVAGATGATGSISMSSGNHASPTNAAGIVTIKTGDQTGTAFSGTGAATTVTTGAITSATATGTSGGTNVLSGNAAGSAATGAVTVRSGNATGTGNSGNVVIQTGSVTSGTRGTINLVDASLAGASVGYVWSLSNTSTGAGNWVAAAAGYTDEQAQDAVGTILVDSAFIDFTYDDATPSISAIVIDGSITNQKIASGLDAVKIGDGSVSNTEFQYLDGVTSPIQTQLNGKVSAQAGDIPLTSFSAADNQASPADITGFAFANASVRSFKALVSVTLDATSDLFESFELLGVQKGATWDLSQSAVGDDSGVVFSITNAGQIQYTSPSSAGFVSLTIKFRAIVTTV